MNQKTRLGVLGGGQLSMMLAQRALALGQFPSILTPSQQDPACSVSPNAYIGNPRNPEDLKKFSSSVDVLTFESEFYDAQYLSHALKDFKGSIFPNLKCLQILQDRKTQKEIFVKNNLKTSPFVHSSHSDEIKKFFESTGPLVAKKRWNGYDGYGTFILRSITQLEKFLETHNREDFIFEKLIHFQYEVAVQVARSRAGHVTFFPFVKTIQKDNKCFLVEGPEKETTQILKIKKSIQRFLNKIDYVGVIGFEFFKTKTDLILNEVAPRVHNTGHHTWDTCDFDQFTMHCLCILQDMLPAVTLKTKAFVMLNLIGQSENEVMIPDRHRGSLYWYGKKNRPGRKLGHINFVGENKKALVNRALKELKSFKF